MYKKYWSQESIPHMKLYDKNHNPDQRAWRDEQDQQDASIWRTPMFTHKGLLDPTTVWSIIFYLPPQS